MTSNLGDLFLLGGWVMWPLLFFSILTWAVVLERTFVYLTLRPKLARMGQAMLNSLKAGDAAAARQLCHAEQQAFVSEVFMGAVDSRRPRESAERLTDRNRARLVSHLKKNLWILGTIGSASPFVGLLGTVIGIVRAFHSMAEKGAGGFSVVSGGISESLISTAAGLIVAIVALLAYNICVTVANQTVGGLKLTLEELLDYTFDKSALATAKA